MKKCEFSSNVHNDFPGCLSPLRETSERKSDSSSQSEYGTPRANLITMTATAEAALNACFNKLQEIRLGCVALSALVASLLS